MLALLLAFTMGFTVTTAHPTNVVVRYKTACSVGEGTTHHETHQFEAVTPIRRTVSETLPGATSCHIRVVAWDVKPWAGPHGNGAVPVVTSWVS